MPLSFYGLLLVARQSGKAVSERVCDAEFHFGSGHPATSASSQNWAIRPTHQRRIGIVRRCILPALTPDINSVAQPTECLKALVWCLKCLNDYSCIRQLESHWLHHSSRTTMQQLVGHKRYMSVPRGVDAQRRAPSGFLLFRRDRSVHRIASLLATRFLAKASFALLQIERETPPGCCA